MRGTAIYARHPALSDLDKSIVPWAKQLIGKNWAKWFQPLQIPGAREWLHVYPNTRKACVHVMLPARPTVN